MIKRLGALALILFILAGPAQAWNGKGHQTVAYIAYKNLDPAVKTKIDELLKSHPDFQRLDNDAGNPSDPNYSLIIFMNAAIWPDTIRDDPRFYDETDSESEPTERIDGFPSMKRFTRWHYIDFPFTTDGSPTTEPASVNALKLMVAARRAINNQNVKVQTRAYLLSWLLHVAGDVHQPLHCTSRFTHDLSPPENPDGDRGGNGFRISPFPVLEGDFSARNLHSFWDNVLGVRNDPEAIEALATQITTEHPKPSMVSTNEQVWIRQSFQLAKTRVYTIQPNTVVSATYFSDAQKLARARIALAGYRLARVLNQRFAQ
jgi:hypothetical protein